MIDSSVLQESTKGWQFVSEKALEDFVWNNLNELLDLTPLARQYAVNGEVSDILSVSEHRQLVIIELKNTEDRYVVQQLTRYYHSLISKKTLAEYIDYTLPIRLVTIAPTFHRNNFIDRHYSTLNIEFYQAFIIQLDGVYDLELEEVNSELSDIPPFLYKKIDSLRSIERSPILKMREKILGFDQKIQELNQGKEKIYYGFTYGKPVAEILFDERTKKPKISLRLPVFHNPNEFRYSDLANYLLEIDITDQGTVQFIVKNGLMFRSEDKKISLPYIFESTFYGIYVVPLDLVDKTPLSFESLIDIALDYYRKRD